MSSSDDSTATDPLSFNQVTLISLTLFLLFASYKYLMRSQSPVRSEPASQSQAQPQPRVPSIRQFITPNPPRPSSSDALNPPNPSTPKIFLPSISDVYETKHILRTCHSRKSGAGSGVTLPAELIDMIIDEAEYWPHQVSCLQEKFCIPRTWSGEDKDKMCLRTERICLETPLPNNPQSKSESEIECKPNTGPKTLPHRGLHPVRKIEFRIQSRDQGWGGAAADHNTYNGSYTWFDVIVKSTAEMDALAAAALNKPQNVKTNNERVGSCISDNDDDDDEGGDNSDETDDDEDGETSPIPNFPLLPPPHVLQKNLVACLHSQLYTITWYTPPTPPKRPHHPSTLIIDPIRPAPNRPANPPFYEDGHWVTKGNGDPWLQAEMLAGLDVGGAVEVWAHARFAGWENYVEGVEVRIFWAV